MLLCWRPDLPPGAAMPTARANSATTYANSAVKIAVLANNSGPSPTDGRDGSATTTVSVTVWNRPPTADRRGEHP